MRERSERIFYRIKERCSALSNGGALQYAWSVSRGIINVKQIIASSDIRTMSNIWNTQERLHVAEIPTQRTSGIISSEIPHEHCGGTWSDQKIFRLPARVARKSLSQRSLIAAPRPLISLSWFFELVQY